MDHVPAVCPGRQDPLPAITKLALSLGLRSRYLLLLFFHIKIHKSPRCLGVSRLWVRRRLRLLLLPDQDPMQEEQEEMGIQSHDYGDEAPGEA